MFLSIKDSCLAVLVCPAIYEPQARTRMLFGCAGALQGSPFNLRLVPPELGFLLALCPI